MVESWLEGLKELNKRNRAGAYPIGEAYARLGDAEQALAWLEKAFEEHDSRLVALKVDPVFESLRANSKFKDLTRRVGLEP